MDTQALNAALDQAAIEARVRTAQPLSGGCIHEVLLITLDDGSEVVAKLSRESAAGLFKEEAAGLDGLAATNSVLVPRPIIVTSSRGKAIFLMEAVKPAQPSREAWQQFGAELAAMHQHDSGRRFGFDIHNHLGTTPQPNTWCDDWVQFNAEHRLGHQVKLARDARLLDGNEAATFDRIINRLDDLIPRHPKPALLHGDLWSGNALPGRAHDGATRIAVIDPAPYIGDGWADIAMMRLFGGFPSDCYERYAACVSDHENVETRIAVYQLYHVLNHVNIFGRGYAGQALSIARSLAG